MRITQEDVILKRLKDWGKISSFEAFLQYGITRLSAVIHRLRKEGYNIESVYKTTFNRLGNSVTYAIYTLKRLKLRKKNKNLTTRKSHI